MLEDGAIVDNVDLCQQILKEKYQYWVIQASLDIVICCILSLDLFLGSLLSPESCSSFPLPSMTFAFPFSYHFFSLVFRL